MERQAKLLGLDAPAKSVTMNVERPLADLTEEDLRRELVEINRQLRSRRATPTLVFIDEIGPHGRVPARSTDLWKIGRTGRSGKTSQLEATA